MGDEDESPPSSEHSHPDSHCGDGRKSALFSHLKIVRPSFLAGMSSRTFPSQPEVRLGSEQAELEHLNEPDDPTPRQRMWHLISASMNLFRPLANSALIFGQEDGQDTSKCFQANIVGYELLLHEKNHVIFKLRVSDNRPWSIDSLPLWHIYRRYTDFSHLDRDIRMCLPSWRGVQLPPRRWFGSNFEPVFLGRRVLLLQTFVDHVLAREIVAQLECVRAFFRLDDPPNHSASLEHDRVVYDALESVVQEMRVQLRQRESFEELAKTQRTLLAERDVELDVLHAEIESLKKQKEALLSALGSANDGNLTLQVPSRTISPTPLTTAMIGSRATSESNLTASKRFLSPINK